MKLFILAGILLVARPGAAQSAPPVQVVAPVRAEEEKVILAFFSEVSAFIRQVLAEPNDTLALAMLQHGPEPARLKQRVQQLQPIMAQWRRTFTDDQLQAVFEDLMQCSEMKALTDLDTDATIKARLKRSSDLKSALEWTIYDMLM
jgi:hypothetical protein